MNRHSSELIPGLLKHLQIRALYPGSLRKQFQRRWTWTGDFKCREVKTGFCRNRSMQTGSSGILIGWISGQTTFVPLWVRMEGSWLWAQKNPKHNWWCHSTEHHLTYFHKIRGPCYIYFLFICKLWKNTNHNYKKFKTLCPFSCNSQSRQSTRLVSPPLWLHWGGGGTHSLSGEGCGGPNSDEGTDTVVLKVYMYFAL